jgi:hypothetical protein
MIASRNTLVVPPTKELDAHDVIDQPGADVR